MSSGFGILSGLKVTFQHFVETYLHDLATGPKRYHSQEGIAERTSGKTKGIFTIQYPDEKMPVPEEFRFLPFLIYVLKDNGEKKFRCTACGICAKVCPTQCIHITRKVDVESGKPIPEPAEYGIDIDICMNCGMCAEFCPFDAIKMDHDYEIASYERTVQHLYNKEKLGKPVEYYQKIRPVNFTHEEAIRLEKEAAKAATQKPGTPGG